MSKKLMIPFIQKIIYVVIGPDGKLDVAYDSEEKARLRLKDIDNYGSEIPVLYIPNYSPSEADITEEADNDV